MKRFLYNSWLDYKESYHVAKYDSLSLGLKRIAALTFIYLLTVLVFILAIFLFVIIPIQLYRNGDHQDAFFLAGVFYGSVFFGKCLIWATDTLMEK